MIHRVFGQKAAKSPQCSVEGRVAERGSTAPCRWAQGFLSLWGVCDFIACLGLSTSLPGSESSWVFCGWSVLRVSLGCFQEPQKTRVPQPVAGGAAHIFRALFLVGRSIFVFGDPLQSQEGCCTSRKGRPFS